MCCPRTNNKNPIHTEKIWKLDCSPMCCLCKEQPERIAHVISGCKMLAANKYTFRHNQVAKYVHWNILKDNDIKVDDNRLKHEPKESVINGGKTITWDISIIIDKKVKCNKPDIIIHNTKDKTCMIIDIAIPNCLNIISKTAEKITKYQEFEIKLKKC